MIDVTLIFCQAVLVMLQAAWLTLGLHDNFRHPRTNRQSIARVLTMELAKDDPHSYEDHKHRRVTNPALIDRLFAAVLVAELFITLGLWTGAGALVLALFEIVPQDGARAIALVAVLAFTGLWGLFLIGGQWFIYWVSANSPQSTHFFMLLWGIATLCFLA